MKTLLSTICLFFSISIAVSGQGIHKLWGTTPFGGKDNAGVIFSLDGKGRNLQKEYEFVNNTPGIGGGSSLIEYNGKLYGLTRSGGLGNGTIYEWDPTDNSYRKRHDFNNFDYPMNMFYWGGPEGNLVLSNNEFYGIINKGGDKALFKWNPESNQYTDLVVFNEASKGDLPNGYLSVFNNKIYGTCRSSGSHSAGVIFEWDPVNNLFTKKHDLMSKEGKGPVGGLTLVDGKFYGITAFGGINDLGAIFEWDPSNNIYTKVFDFATSTVVEGIIGSLVFLNGKFYGLSRATGEGAIFEWNPANQEVITQYNFKDDPNRTGYSADGELVLYEGKLYVATQYGGLNNNGAIVEFDPESNLLESKHRFESYQGKCVLSLIGDKFYGTTSESAEGAGGIIFEWNKENDILEKKLEFNYLIGAYPNGKLLLADGKLYGITNRGGTKDKGTIFEFDYYSNKHKKLLDFKGAIGYTPFGNLNVYQNKFFGMSFWGAGFIFSWDPETEVLRQVQGFDVNDNGRMPYGDLVNYKGKFYGMTRAGGDNDQGIIFEWDPETNFYLKKQDFDGNMKGGAPYGSLTLKGDDFYGVAHYGGALFSGVLFKWNPVSNEYFVEHDFTYNGGYIPYGSLTLYKGEFYGMALAGGSMFLGVMYKFNPDTKVFTKILDFNGSELGSNPSGGLVVYNDKFYGMTNKGGQHNYGVVFEWDPKTNIFTKTVDFNGENGRSPRLDQLTPVPAPTAKGTPGSCLQLPNLTIDATNNKEWVPITDDKGEAIAEIKANGNVLGDVAVSLYVHDGAVREDSYRKLFLDRNITITPTNQPTTPVDVRFYVRKSEFEALAEAKNSLDLSSGVDAIARVGIYKTSENSCQSGAVQLTNPVTTVSGTWSEDYVLSASVSSFSTFYFAHYDNTPLPLNLISFKAQLQGKDGLLTWRTAEEVNVSHFEVERSVDGKVFSYLGTVPLSSKGDNGIYRLVDKDVAELLSGTAYYRLKMVDKDGTFSRSSMISLALPESGSFISIYPNPVSAKLSVDLKKSGAVSWIITDVNGKQLTSGKSENRQFEIDTQSFSAGLYFLQVTSESLVKTVKFVKQ